MSILLSISYSFPIIKSIKKLNLHLFFLLMVRPSRLQHRVVRESFTLYIFTQLFTSLEFFIMAAYILRELYSTVEKYCHNHKVGNRCMRGNSIGYSFSGEGKKIAA